MRLTLYIVLTLCAFVSHEIRVGVFDLSLLGYIGLTITALLVGSRFNIRRESSVIVLLLFYLLLMYVLSVLDGSYNLNVGRVLKLCFFIFSVPFLFDFFLKLNRFYFVSYLNKVNLILLLILILGFLLDFFIPGVAMRIVYENALDQNINSGFFIKYVRFN